MYVTWEQYTVYQTYKGYVYSADHLVWYS